MGWRDQSERGNAISAWLLRQLTSRLPRRLVQMLIPPVAAYYLLTHREARLASRRFLDRALGRPASVRDSYRQFATFATVLADRFYLLRGADRALDIRIDDSSRRTCDRLIARGGGFFMMGAHLGSFELARAIGRAEGAPPVVMVMFEENARRIGAALQALDPSRSLSIIALGQPDSMLKVRDALDAGAIVGMLPDRLLTENPALEDTRTIDFLGLPARFPIGPFRLAALLRRPVLLQLGVHEGGRRYRFIAEEIADFGSPEINPRGGAHAAAELALRRYVERLELYARRYPANWFNFFDLWTVGTDAGQSSDGSTAAPGWRAAAARETRP